MSRMRRRGFLTDAAYLAVIVGLVFLVFRYLLGLLWPFFAAFVFAWALKPAIRWLTARCRLKYDLSVALCLAVFFTVLAGLVTLILSRLVTGISELIVWLSSLYDSAIRPGLESLAGLLEELADRVSPGLYDTVAAALPNVMASIGTAVTDLSMGLVSALSGWAAKLPGFLLAAVICIIATIFMTADFPRITSFLLRQVPERPRHIVSEAVGSLRTVLKKYGRSYGIIMAITFAELLFGFLLLGQRNALPLAFLIAVVDVFPIVGTGLFLLPWAAVSLLGGAVGKGLGLLGIYAVVIVVRQAAEPRIVGRQVGLHPLVTLMAMFAGTKLFGVMGLLGLPITCAIVKSLDEAGVIHVIKHENAPRPATPDVPSAPPEGSAPVKPGKSP